MSLLDANLIARLAEAGVRVEVRDDDTAVFHGMPTDGRAFTKPRTNLLLTRPGVGLPFLVCVDEDLDYTGDDPALAQAFAAARREHGWRVLPVGRGLRRQLQAALEEAADLLGAGVCDPPSRLAREPRRGLLGSHGIDLTARHAAGTGETTVGRCDEIEHVLACLGQLRGILPVVTGPHGVGKTNLLHGVAARLLERRPETALVAIDLGTLFAGHVFDAERENVLRALLAEAADDAVVIALENLQLLFLEAPHGPLLLSAALERGTRVVGTALPGITTLAGNELLGGRLEKIPLGEPGGPHATVLMLREVAPRVAAHHGVAIDEDGIRLVIDRAPSLPGYLPGKAVTLLDRAASRAALLGDELLNEVHIHLAAAEAP